MKTVEKLQNFFVSPKKTENNKLECPFCKVIIVKNYKRHLLLVHRGLHIRKNKWTCPWCENFSSVNKKEIQKHVLKVHPNQANPKNETYMTHFRPNFTCSYDCPFKSYSLDSIKVHEKTVHKSQTTFDHWKQKFLFTRCVRCKKNLPNSEIIKHSCNG